LNAEIALTDYPVEADERALIVAAQGDAARFGALYERYFDRVYAFVISRVHDRDAAEDLTAQTFHRALENLGKFEWRGVPFSAWLLRIAGNAMADRWAALGRERGVEAAEVGETFDTDAIENRARLFGLVRRLPPEQRRVVLMRFVEQRSVREIAAALQKTEGAVKQLQFRALTSLRETMVKVGRRMGARKA
jgi:RNA polymerase sigma-70 factor, ECF subfamily